jgi:1-acyl-sn-glycerol-3-phosphate acyltransferase
VFALAFYVSLKQYCRLALRLFFRQWQVRFVAPLPKGPVIFVANHQSAFMDAILVICSSAANPWSIARANIFGKPWAVKALTLVQIKPLYRFRDGFSTMRKNDAAMEEYAQMLINGKSLLIFAEGNDDGYWKLRPLQKGFARIALRAEEKSNYTLGLTIVPVGVQYEDHAKFRSRVLVTFGEAIPVVTHHAAATDNGRSPKDELDTDTLINKTVDGLKPLMLHIEGHGDEYERKAAYLYQHHVTQNDLAAQLAADQAIVKNIPTNLENVAPVRTTKSWPWLNPLFLYAFVNHLLPGSIISWFVKKKVHNEQFHSSIQYAFGLVLVPLFYCLQTSLFFSITHSGLWSLIYFISLPISLSLTRRKLVVSP